MQVLLEYLQLWELLEGLELQPEVEDTHIWQFSTSGNFSTKSAYEAFCIGSIQFKILGKNLEKLGPWQMQILLMDSSSQEMRQLTD